MSTRAKSSASSNSEFEAILFLVVGIFVTGSFALAASLAMNFDFQSFKNFGIAIGAGLLLVVSKMK